jgi:hypothetical protein
MSEKTQANFQEWAITYLKQVHELLKGKGGQYSEQNKYALRNFQSAAKYWGTTEMYQILQYATKHWVFLIDEAQDSLFKALTPKDKRMVEESARDLIIYMLLLIYGQLS